MKRLGAFFFLLIVILSNFIFTQQLVWKHTGGPMGGIVGDIAINSKGDIYAGVYPFWIVYSGLYKSTDNGNTWNKIITQFDDFEVYAIYITKEDHIWVGTNFQGRIYRSTDNGQTWENKSNGYNTGECWAFGKSKNDVMFAGDGQYIKLYRSVDYGENWEFSANLRPLVFATDSNNIVYAGTHDGLFATTDNGITWAQNISLANIPVSSIIIDTNNNIYCGTGYYSNGDGVFYSTDGGQNWTQLGLAGKVVLSLAFDSRENLYAGTLKDGLFKTTDMGQTWTQYQNGLYRKQVFRLKLNKQDHIFIGSEDEGVFRSIDNGNSFRQIGLPISKVNNIVFSRDSLILAATPSGVQKFNRFTTEWTNLGLQNVEAITITPSNYLYAATYDEGLYKSTDLGKTWSLTNLTIDSLISVYNVLAVNDDTVFSLTGFNLRYTTNGGLNWNVTPIRTGFFSRVLFIDFYNNLWVSGYGKNNYVLYRSIDMGTSFDSLYYGFFCLFQNSFSVTKNRFIYLSDLSGARKGITRSTNYGATWSNVLPKQMSKSVFGDENGLVIAGSDSIYTSTDFGNTWNYQIYLGYDNFINEIEFYNGKYYFGTDRTGLYEVDIITRVAEHNNLHLTAYSLFQNYPNPFNPKTTIRFCVPRSSHITLNLYNLLGQKLVSLISGVVDAGYHEVGLNLSEITNGHTSGVYFYRLQASDMTSSSILFTQTKKLLFIK